MVNPTTAAATHFPAIRTFPLMAASFTSTATGGSERKNRPRSCYFFRNCDGAAPIGRNHRFFNVRGACPQPQSFLVHLCFTVQVKAKRELSGLEHPLDLPPGRRYTRCIGRRSPFIRPPSIRPFASERSRSTCAPATCAKTDSGSRFRRSPSRSSSCCWSVPARR